MGLASKMNPKVVEITEPDPNHACVFCHKHEINPVEYGAMYQLDNLTLHYFCLLFSAGLVQNGEDDDGILGFLPVDIQKEVKRGNKLKCLYCKKHSATVGCIKKTCKSSFHYTCGIARGTLHQFYDQYSSFCHKCKPKCKPTQIIPNGTDWNCPICFTDVETPNEAVWPPCCGKSVFHRSCLMRAARNAGYFFKCPLCNDKSEKFLLAMKSNGVFVPEEDAAWEREPNAFAELQQQYSTCDARICQCPAGRNMDDKSDMRWKILRCGGCGATATHVKCSDLFGPGALSWKCETCVGILTDNSRVNISELVSDSGPRSLRTHVDARNLNYSSDSDDRTSEGSDYESDESDTSDDEQILKRIPNPQNIIESESGTSSDDDDNEQNHNPSSELTLVPLPPATGEEAKQDDKIVYNPSSQKLHKVVKLVEQPDLMKRKRKQRVAKNDKEKKRSKRVEADKKSSERSAPVAPAPSTSNGLRKHPEKRKKKRRLSNLQQAARTSEGGNAGPSARLEFMFDKPPASSARREEEAQKRRETIQSILKPGEQSLNIAKLPKIPKLVRQPPKNNFDEDKRRSILNIERMRREEEEWNNATRNLRGVDPKIFYHNKRHDVPSNPPASRPCPTHAASTEFEGAPNASLPSTSTPALPHMASFPIPTINTLQNRNTLPDFYQEQTAASHSSHSSSQYFGRPTTSRPSGPPEQNYADFFEDDYPPYDASSRAHELWFSFGDYNNWENNENYERSRNTEFYPLENSNGYERVREGRQDREPLTGFYDDTPTIRIRKEYHNQDFDEADQYKLSRRNYPRRECDEDNDKKQQQQQRERFYNPHSAKVKSPMVNPNHVPTKPGHREELADGSSLSQEISQLDVSGVATTSARNDDDEPRPSCSNFERESTADDSCEVEVLPPPKKPEIEVIDLSDDDDEIEVVGTKVVSPPITTVKSAAFMSMLSGNPNPLRPMSSASSSTSGGTRNLFYHSRPPTVVPHDYWFNQRHNQRKTNKTK